MENSIRIESFLPLCWASGWLGAQSSALHRMSYRLQGQHVHKDPCFHADPLPLTLPFAPSLQPHPFLDVLVDSLHKSYQRLCTVCWNPLSQRLVPSCHSEFSFNVNSSKQPSMPTESKAVSQSCITSLSFNFLHSPYHWYFSCLFSSSTSRL